MALILTDGFETYGSNAANMVPTGGGPWTTVSAVNWNFGGRTGAESAAGAPMTKTFTADAHATVIAGCAYNSAANNIDIIRFFGDGATLTEHVVIRRTLAGALAIDRGSTQVAITADGVIPTSDWFYLEAAVTLDDTSGSVDVYLNGSSTPILSFTGDTRNGGTAAVIDSVQYYSNNAAYVFDDVYIVTGGGAAPTTKLGEIRCYLLSPNGNGYVSQGVGSDSNSTDNYLLVDESIANALNPADYVGISTDGNKDMYAYSDLGVASGTVLRVRSVAYTLKSDAGAKSMRQVVRPGSTDYVGSDVLLSTTYARTEHTMDVNPDTLSPWSISEVNATQFGFEARP